ncbi:MAG: phage tail tape measure protein, partial [Chthoniobacterales bacterium]
MAVTAEQLNIIIAARDREFARAMEQNVRRIERFSKQTNKGLGDASKSFDMLGSAAKRLAPLLAAAFSVQAVRATFDMAKNLDNLAAVAGVDVERFQELAIGVRQFGVEQDKLADILKDVNDKFGDYMQTGAGPLADFFENIAPKVGLTAEAFANLSSEQKLGAYVKALQDANVSQAEMT